MKRGLIYGLAAVIVLGAIGGAVFLAWTFIGGGSGEASAPISAPTLALNTATPLPQATAAEAAATEEVAPPAAPTEVQAGGEGTAVLYRITPDESEVRFIIHEELLNTPATVVGRTDQVTGDIIADYSHPANSQVGTIRINARTLLTDNEFRNRALRNQILQSAQDAYEFITFTPTTLEGLPESVTPGEPFSFQITGDLTVRDVTRPVTFTATVTPVSEGRLEGTASAQVLRSDFGLTIPSVPGVANVTNDVTLEIDFVALAVES